MNLSMRGWLDRDQDSCRHALGQPTAATEGDGVGPEVELVEGDEVLEQLAHRQTDPSDPAEQRCAVERHAQLPTLQLLSRHPPSIPHAQLRLAHRGNASLARRAAQSVPCSSTASRKLGHASAAQGPKGCSLRLTTASCRPPSTSRKLPERPKCP